VTIVYKTNDTWPGIKFPKLYKVVYSRWTDGVLAAYRRSYKDHLVDEWLKENCKHGYYHSPGYLEEKFIQFEDDEEAFVFALKFSGQDAQSETS